MTVTCSSHLPAFACQWRFARTGSSHASCRGTLSCATLGCSFPAERWPLLRSGPCPDKQPNGHSGFAWSVSRSPPGRCFPHGARRSLPTLPPRARGVCRSCGSCWHHHCKKFLAGPKHTLNYPWGTQKKTGKGLGWYPCLALVWIQPNVWLPSTERLLSLPWAALCLFLWEFPFDEWLQQQDCVIAKRASSWSILKHLWACTHCCYYLEPEPHTGLLPFWFWFFFSFLFLFFFFFSYYNSEVWLKSVGVEQDQLCLRAFSNPVVNMLYSSSLEGNPMVHYRTTGELGQGCLSQDSFCCCFSITVVCKSWNEARGTVINVPNSFTWGFNEIIQPLSLDCKSSPKWERPSCSLQLLISSWNTWELGI